MIRPPIARVTMLLAGAAFLTSCGEAYGPLSLASQLELRMTVVNPVVMLPWSQGFELVVKNVSTRPVAYDPECFGLGVIIYKDGVQVDGAGPGCLESSRRLQQLAPGDSLTSLVVWEPMTKDVANNPQWMPEGEYVAEARYVAALGGIRGPRVSFEIRKP